MEIVKLTDNWTFKKIGSDIGPLSAEIPSSQFTDMLRHNLIPDPFIGTNEKAVAEKGEGDWIYACEFTLGEDTLAREKAILHFDCLDTIAEVSLNGERVATSNNYFLPVDIDVSGRLRQSNSLSVLFKSPTQYVNAKQEQDRMPRNSNGLNGIPHIRKPGCHFGWDWGPALPSVGIAGDAYIKAYDGARIADIELAQKHKDGKVKIDAGCKIEGAPKDGATIELSLYSPSGEKIDSKEMPAIYAEDAKAQFTVDKPMLWWSAELSGKAEQPLYSVQAILKQGEMQESLSKKIGLRTIELDTGADEYGSQFAFKLNGKPIFVKGANYIPPDALLTRANKSTYEFIINAMLEAGMNCVRVWGGGRYEQEAFYDLCDKKGLLVWQDFMYACQPYPFYDDELLSNVLKETAYQVKRLRHRACLMLWCGNNEIEVMSPAWATYTKLRDWTQKFFYEILPAELRKYDTATPYIPGSPCGVGYLDKTASDNHGDTHLWSVWHGLQPLTYYRKRMTRFCSEFGLESIPDENTVNIFCSEEDKRLDSATMRAHQKCLSGNDKIAYYISTRFRLPKKFDDLIYLSQITQSECVRDATEHWRRNRGRCNGSIYWQLNDCWPVMSWSSIDYYGRYKALQYSAKHFNAPLSVSIAEDKCGAAIYVINDTLSDFRGTVKYSLQKFDGQEITCAEIAANCNNCKAEKITYIDFKRLLKKVKYNCVLITSLIDSDGNTVSRKTTLFAPEKNLDLPKPNISTDVKVNADTAEITVSSDSYARYVKISLKGSAEPLSDNYFDLTAGESKTITVKVDADTTAEDVKSILSVKSAVDVTPAGSETSDALLRWKVRLNPINFANWIGYHFM